MHSVHIMALSKLQNVKFLTVTLCVLMFYFYSIHTVRWQCTIDWKTPFSICSLKLLSLTTSSPENISKWVGTLHFKDENEPIAVGMNQFLLRGCTLRNTDWIIGIVVFTGIETKISLNNKEMPFKRSNVRNISSVPSYSRKYGMIRMLRIHSQSVCDFACFHWFSHRQKQFK